MVDVARVNQDFHPQLVVKSHFSVLNDIKIIYFHLKCLLSILKIWRSFTHRFRPRLMDLNLLWKPSPFPPHYLVLTPRRPTHPPCFLCWEILVAMDLSYSLACKSDTRDVEKTAFCYRNRHPSKWPPLLKLHPHEHNTKIIQKINHRSNFVNLSHECFER